MTRKKWEIGEQVTVTERQEAYDSRYVSTAPEIWIEPGEVGIIAAVDVPKVYRTPGGPFFCCIDFEKGGKQHRAGVSYQFIKWIEEV